MSDKPFAAAADQNKEVILSVLAKELESSNTLLEIGSGTGQHAVFMAPELTQLTWQPSDLHENLPGIQAWMKDYPGSNILPPIYLDVCESWPQQGFDAIYTCNTLHLLSIAQISCLLHGAGAILHTGGKLCCYGPFNINGAYTSESNKRFDHALRLQNPDYGIRDKQWLDELAQSKSLLPCGQHPMPHNNYLMVWQAA